MSRLWPKSLVADLVACNALSTFIIAHLHGFVAVSLPQGGAPYVIFLSRFQQTTHQPYSALHELAPLKLNPAYHPLCDGSPVGRCMALSVCGDLPFSHVYHRSSLSTSLLSICCVVVPVVPPGTSCQLGARTR